MNILVVCQYYYPEPFRVNDLCEEMVKRGHEVTVVTGEPNYPEGIIYDGYQNHAHADEIINGVHVYRCPIIPRKTGALYRLLNYFSFPYQANKVIKKLCKSGNKPFDIVFVNQLSPVMMAEPAIKYRKAKHVKAVLYCLDLWPESLIAGGIGRNSLIYKLFFGISKRIYRKMDRILISSRMFRGYLVDNFGVAQDRIGYFPQYAEGLFEKLPYKEPAEITNFVFAGNIGEIQSLDTVIRAAEKLTDQPVCFQIVGGGTDLERLKELAKDLPNVVFCGRKNLEEMPAVYATADAMLITLKADPVLSLTLPGKMQSYMACGKPVIGAINGETATVIGDSRCGFCGPAEDADALADNILRFLAATEAEKRAMGDNARQYYERFFARSIFMDGLEKELAAGARLGREEETRG